MIKKMRNDPANRGIENNQTASAIIL